MMKAKFITFFLFISLYLMPAIVKGEEISNKDVFLLTCSPGVETYSHWGHSALRVVDHINGTDIVFNWGLFDFSTPNFAWKFAKGRLDYLLGAQKTESFLQGYVYEERWVKSQKINLTAEETDRLLAMIIENLKPENVSYRYDFFYDDCSTRIRDLIEKSIGETLIYPPDEKKGLPTFRQMVRKYQSPYPWLQFGIDLIMGLPGEKKAGFRDQMFLPVDMMNGLSEAVVRRDGKMIPLLQNPATLVDFPESKPKTKFLASPLFICSMLLIMIIIFTAAVRNRRANLVIDTILYSLFSLLAVLMLFFNFFTDHEQMQQNLNILWLNPFLFVGLVGLFLKKELHIWYKIIFMLCLLSFVIQLFMPSAFNSAFLPLTVIIIIRASVRAGFSWNPVNI